MSQTRNQKMCFSPIKEQIVSVVTFTIAFFFLKPIVLDWFINGS